MTTKLPDQKRGATFRYTFTLGNSWTGATFTGGVKFTLREQIPASTVHDDADAVDQGSVATGEITFVGAVGTIVFPASRTTSWPAKKLFWDLQGVISGAEPDVKKVDSGTILIDGDVTRSV